MFERNLVIGINLECLNNWVVDAWAKFRRVRFDQKYVSSFFTVEKNSPKCTIIWVNCLKVSYQLHSVSFYSMFTTDIINCKRAVTEDKTPCKINEISFSDQQLHLKRSIGLHLKRSIGQVNIIVLLKPAPENLLMNKIQNLYSGAVALEQVYKLKRSIGQLGISLFKLPFSDLKTVTKNQMYSVDKLPSTTSTVHQLTILILTSHQTNTIKCTTKLITMYNLFSSRKKLYPNLKTDL